MSQVYRDLVKNVRWWMDEAGKSNLGSLECLLGLKSSAGQFADTISRCLDAEVGERGIEKIVIGWEEMDHRADSRPENYRPINEVNLAHEAAGIIRQLLREQNAVRADLIVEKSRVEAMKPLLRQLEHQLSLEKELRKAGSNIPT